VLSKFHTLQFTHIKSLTSNGT